MMGRREQVRKLREGAAQLREDAVECWGIRRKLNLRAAAKIMDDAADRLERDAPWRRLWERARRVVVPGEILGRVLRMPHESGAPRARHPSR